MKTLIFLTILFQLSFSPKTSASEVFTVSERFFTKSEKESQQIIVKPKECPDGSKFLALDTSIDQAGNEIDIATCYYFKKLPLIMEHTWVNGIKEHEVMYIPNKNEDTTHGIEKLRLSDNKFAISEFCQGYVIRSEIADRNGKVEAIILYDRHKLSSVAALGTLKPNAFINLLEPDKSVISESIRKFNGCDFSRYTEVPIYKKLFNRKWLPVLPYLSK